jgi:pimeloyl-ACP methyl ester carboxylesterase
MVTPDEKKPALVNEMIFPKAWLDAKSETDPKGRSNAEVQTEVCQTSIRSCASLIMFWKAFIRRIAVTTPQAFMGHISQMAAGLTHHCTPDRLRMISKSIPKVAIVTGDDDHLVRPRNSFRLKAAMPEAELLQWEHTGHSIHVQRVKEFNALIERVCTEARKELA